MNNFLLKLINALSILLIVFAFLNIGFIFNVISAKTFLVLFVSIFISILLITYLFNKFKVKSLFLLKLDFWKSFNKTKLYLICVIALSFSCSLRKEIFFESQTFGTFLSLQWTIFSITIAIFLVWNGIILPKFNVTEKSGITIFEKAIDKMFKYEEINSKFTSIFFIIINILTLSITSAAVFLFEKNGLFVQTLEIFNFYVTINTMTQILMDIILFQLEAKNELLQGYKENLQIVNSALNCKKKLKSLSKRIDKLEKSKDISIEEKIVEIKNIREEAQKLENLFKKP